MSTKKEQLYTVELQEGMTASLNGRKLSIKGKLGEVTKDFERIHVDLAIDGRKVAVRPFSSKKKDTTVAHTAVSIIDNMVNGVTHGYTYRLKIVYAHFPISVRVKEAEIHIENFMGERSPRIAKIIGDCKASVEGDDIVIKGTSIEDVSQTASNVDHVTRVRRKDQRIFLDGIYIYQKKSGW